jgi:hypothetical protein
MVVKVLIFALGALNAKSESYYHVFILRMALTRIRNLSNNIALFDADIILYAVGFTTQDVEEEYIIDSRIEEYLSERFAVLPEKHEFYLSHPTLYRKQKYPDYKENRKDFVKPKWHGYIKDYLVENYGAVMQEGFEADDLLGIRGTELNGTGIIVSVDKDLYQIPGHHFNLRHKTFHYVTDEEAFDWYATQCLTGDKIDNIEGLAGIGPARASKILMGATTREDYFRAIFDGYFDRGSTTEASVKCSELVYIYRSYQAPTEKYTSPYAKWLVSQGLLD